VDLLHTPVLALEVVNGLNIRPGGTYLDATAGAGGHSFEIASRLQDGRLVALDRDPDALEAAHERLGEYKDRVTLVQANFSQIGEVAREMNLPPLDGVLADLGVSSMQFDRGERGFSIRNDGPLDMRMNPADEVTAQEIVNTWPERELADLLYQLAEERDSRRIARAIVRARPIRDTGHLATVVAGSRRNRGRQRLHPATKTFLALRIAVNRESEELGQFLARTPATLASGGRWVVLSYHSLEDRAVKQAFQLGAREGQLKIITRKVIQTGEEEMRSNPRARSARLRVAEKAAGLETVTGPEIAEHEDPGEPREPEENDEP
jgi:16S rRNA (cytosine1402-N4)-methyltransferase